MRLITATVALTFLAGTAQAITPFSEPFTYSDGNLTAVSSGAWVAHSAAGTNPVQVTGNTAVLQQGAGSREDVNRSFAPAVIAGGTVFAAFNFSNTGGSGDVYFAHFKDAGTFNFAARVYITAPGGGGDYRVGLSASSGAIGAVWGSDLVFGTTYKAILGFDRSTGTATLWIDPINSGSTSISHTNAAAGAFALEAFALRQATPTSGSSTQVIDNILIGNTFEEVIPTPGAAVLLGIAGVVGFRRRR